MSMNTTTKTDDVLQILKTATCSSLSGKTQLTYQIGRAGKGDVRFRITGNTHAGCFSPEWVPLKDVLSALDDVEDGETVTADALMGLFRGVSANTPFFIFAALKHEGLVKLSAVSKRRYERVDPKPFLAAIQAPGEAKEDTSSKPKKVKQKTTTKKKAVRR